jgi:peptide/nickel transport system permease protein
MSPAFGRVLLRSSVGVLCLLGAVAIFGNGIVGAFSGKDSAAFAWANAARGTLLATAVAAVVTFGVGTLVGALAALGPPGADALLSRAMAIAGALPALVAVVVVRSLAPLSSLTTIGLVLGTQRGLSTAKVFRANLLQLCGEEFVLSARALGSSRRRLFYKHLYPHACGLPLASASFSGAAVVALDAALSLLGLGGNVSTWGSLLAEAAKRSTPTLALAPVFGVLLTLVPLQIIADTLEARASTRQRFI